jgi:hypothetical protein
MTTTQTTEGIMTTTTTNQIISALQTAGIPRRIPSSRAIRAREITRSILAPLVPVGTYQWLASPEQREAIGHYAERAVSTAAARSAWAGGLSDGTHVHDRAIVESVAAIIR